MGWYKTPRKMCNLVVPELIYEDMLDCSFQSNILSIFIEQLNTKEYVEQKAKLLKYFVLCCNDIRVSIITKIELDY